MIFSFTFNYLPFIFSIAFFEYTNKKLSLNDDQTVDKRLIIRLPNVLTLRKTASIVYHDVSLLNVAHVVSDRNEFCLEFLHHKLHIFHQMHRNTSDSLSRDDFSSQSGLDPKMGEKIILNHVLYGINTLFLIAHMP